MGHHGGQFALRRALLSSIEGAAITAVKIEGVLHEFSSIPGVVEDATDIILNLKQVPLKLNNDQAKTIFVNVENPGVVTSAMIEEDADFAVLDKTVYIATVNEGGKLQLEMRVKNGRGYVSADRNFDEDLPIGYIPVDSVHSPVRKVNYAVEAARLGQMTDYEKLSLEVWTNGAITPQDAIGLASKLVKDHMSIFINFEEQPEVVEESVESYNDPRVEHLDRSVEELELSVRSYNCLKNANIQTIRELVQKSENEMLKTKNFGRKSLNEIKEILNKMGLSLGMKFDEHGRIIWPPLPSQTAPRRRRKPRACRAPAGPKHATSQLRIETRTPAGASPRHAPQPRDQRDREGTHHHHAHAREGREAARREDDHARQARHAAHRAARPLRIS